MSRRWIAIEWKPRSALFLKRQIPDHGVEANQERQQRLRLHPGETGTGRSTSRPFLTKSKVRKFGCEIAHPITCDGER